MEVTTNSNPTVTMLHLPHKHTVPTPAAYISLMPQLGTFLDLLSGIYDLSVLLTYRAASFDGTDVSEMRRNPTNKGQVNNEKMGIRP
jgi:hypothetical protein